MAVLWKKSLTLRAAHWQGIRVTNSRTISFSEEPQWLRCVLLATCRGIYLRVLFDVLYTFEPHLMSTPALILALERKKSSSLRPE